MSDVKNYGALNFKFSKKFEDFNEAYNVLRGVLGEPSIVEYESYWDGKEFVKTDKVEYFSYGEKKGSYVVYKDDFSDDWYLDYLIIDLDENYQDLSIFIDLNKLNSIKDEVVSKLPDILFNECRLKVFEWYTGTDIPTTFKED